MIQFQDETPSTLLFIHSFIHFVLAAWFQWESEMWTWVAPSPSQLAIFACTCKWGTLRAQFQVGSNHRFWRVKAYIPCPVLCEIVRKVTSIYLARPDNPQNLSAESRSASLGSSRYRSSAKCERPLIPGGKPLISAAPQVRRYTWIKGHVKYLYCDECIPLWCTEVGLLLVITCVTWICSFMSNRSQGFAAAAKQRSGLTQKLCLLQHFGKHPCYTAPMSGGTKWHVPEKCHFLVPLKNTMTWKKPLDFPDVKDNSREILTKKDQISSNVKKLTPEVMVCGNQGIWRISVPRRGKFGLHISDVVLCNSLVVFTVFRDTIWDSDFHSRSSSQEFLLLFCQTTASSIFRCFSFYQKG